MTKVILDSGTLKNWRAHMSDAFEICDPAGKVLGCFFPVADAALYQSVKVPFTEKELDAFEMETGGRSLSEILRDLPS